MDIHFLNPCILSLGRLSEILNYVISRPYKVTEISIDTKESLLKMFSYELESDRLVPVVHCVSLDEIK